VSGIRGGDNARKIESQPERERRRSGVGRILVFGVVLFVLAITVVGVFSNSQRQVVAGATAPIQNADCIDVIYFHRTERCASCLWAGQMSRKTVESYFAGELANGRVTFQEVDVQKPENRTLAYKFRASGSQLFLNFVSGGKEHIVEAQYVYPYVGNEAKFTGQLRSAISSGLGGS
jgi:hypothetical protein